MAGRELRTRLCAIGADDWGLATPCEGWSDEGALGRRCATVIGEIAGGQLLRFRVLDLVVHSWDLARAIGTNEDLDIALVEHTRREIEPIAPEMGSMGVFGQGRSGTLPEDAPLQIKLLDASGRRP